MKTRTAVIVGAVLLTSLARILPHWENYAPVTAMAIFGAAALADWRLALVTPLLCLGVSDLCVEGAYRLGLMHSWGVYPSMWTVYVSMLAVTGVGFLLRRRRNPVAIAGVTLAGSVTFFVLSNFGVWAVDGLYPHTAAGLAACYAAAVPFFRTSLLGDAVYATALFGGLALAERWWPALAARNPEEHAEKPVLA